ncbi:substrate-binding domain-containing protein [Alkalicella caledoniensis]|uniref:substrate-binding domain-containing protein n=1 Tax=Alkalicella caledoniensis TaxID=2731377 RepID=UPI001BCF2FE5|nr:substrate-binding domain-containing protein [Alkalicella caledoniensis]
MKKKIISLTLILLMATVVFAGCNSESGREEDGPILIGGLTSLSGALMDYGEQMQRGFMLGLEYATDGTMEVAGRELKVIWEDTTTVPEVARERAIKLLDDDEVDFIVGPASSADAAAILGLAEEYERIFFIEPAAADFLTGTVGNRYIFRAARNTAQDAAAMAAVILNNDPGAKVATFAPDSAFGHASVEPFKKVLEARGGELIMEEYPPADATDFTPYITRILNSDADYVFVIWAGANNPWRQMQDLGLFEEKTVTTGAPELAGLRGMLDIEGGVGFTVYYHGVAKNPVNEWLINRHQEEYGTVPDIFVSGGMATAMAMVKAIQESEGSTDAEELIAILRGMEFDSPTGMRYFREEDHQAQQHLFEIKFTRVDGVDHIVPELVRVIPHAEVEDAIQVTHPR